MQLRFVVGTNGSPKLFLDENGGRAESACLGLFGLVSFASAGTTCWKAVQNWTDAPGSILNGRLPNESPTPEQLGSKACQIWASLRSPAKSLTFSGSNGNPH